MIIDRNEGANLWRRQRFVSCFVHEILTRQTCGQRSSKAAESKRRALGNYFPEWICCMFLISKCRRGWDPGLCTTSVLAFGEPQRNGKIRFFLRHNTFFFSDVAIALHFSKRKYWSCAQTWILVSSTFWYQEHIANSLAPKSLSLRRVSIQKPSSQISQLSSRQNDVILPDTNL